MRAMLEGPLEAGADRAGRAIETTLARAVRTGKLGFEDLKKVALSVLGEIGAVAMRSGIDSVLGGQREPKGAGLLGELVGVLGSAGGTSGGSMAPGAGLLGSLIGVLGSPGRATGGPVSPGRPFWVGERGPELFVPTAAGSVVPTGGGAARDVRVSITVNAASDAAPAALARSSRQVARAVKAALAGVDD
jgi:hypothetical protein